MFVFFYKGLDNIESGSDIIRRIDTIVNLLYRYKFTPPPPSETDEQMTLGPSTHWPDCRRKQARKDTEL